MLRGFAGWAVFGLMGGKNELGGGRGGSEFLGKVLGAGTLQEVLVMVGVVPQSVCPKPESPVSPAAGLKRASANA